MGQDGSGDLVKCRAAPERCLVVQKVETQEDAIKLLEKCFQGVDSCALCLCRLRGVRSTTKFMVVITHSQQKTEGRKHTLSARDSLGEAKLYTRANGSRM